MLRLWSYELNDKEFFKFQSESILALRSNRRQETVSMLKLSIKQQNWLAIVFGIQLIWRHILAFQKKANSVIEPL